MARIRKPLAAPTDVSRPHRLAVAIVKGVASLHVICKLEDWGIGAVIAASTLRMWCRAGDLHPRDVVGFVRALSAIHRARHTRLDPVDLLEFADRRSIDRFLQLSGPLGTVANVVSVAQFCRQQRFLTHDRIISDVIRLMS